MTETPMIRVGSSFTVTASAEHIPSTCTVIGFSSLSGSATILRRRFDSNGSDGFLATAEPVFSSVSSAIIFDYLLTDIRRRGGIGPNFLDKIPVTRKVGFQHSIQPISGERCS